MDFSTERECCSLLCRLRTLQMEGAQEGAQDRGAFCLSRARQGRCWQRRRGSHRQSPHWQRLNAGVLLFLLSWCTTRDSTSLLVNCLKGRKHHFLMSYKYLPTHLPWRMENAGMPTWFMHSMEVAQTWWFTTGFNDHLKGKDTKYGQQQLLIETSNISSM